MARTSARYRRENNICRRGHDDSSDSEDTREYVTVEH